MYNVGQRVRIDVDGSPISCEGTVLGEFESTAGILSGLNIVVKCEVGKTWHGDRTLEVPQTKGVRIVTLDQGVRPGADQYGVGELIHADGNDALHIEAI